VPQTRLAMVLSNPYPTAVVLSNPYPTAVVLSNPYPTAMVLSNPYPTAVVLSNPYPTAMVLSVLYPPAIQNKRTNAPKSRNAKYLMKTSQYLAPKSRTHPSPALNPLGLRV
jgi:hypothetical protein